MRAASGSIRFAWAALFALLLSVRVLASSGYMPELEDGRLTLMLCPDGQWTAQSSAMPDMAGMAGHDDRSSSHHHLTCPYAAAAAMPFASAESAKILVLAPLPFIAFAGNALATFVDRRRFERPYSTGPPLRA
jgi:hypothetical protein